MADLLSDAGIPLSVADTTQQPASTSTDVTKQDDDELSLESARLQESFIRLTTGTPDDTDTDTTNEDGYQQIRTTDAASQGPFYRRYLTWITTANDYNNDNSTMDTTMPTVLLPSLAQAPTTPTILTMLLPLACIVTHLIFAYAQWAPMCRLSLTAEDINVTAQAQTTMTKKIFNQLGLHNTPGFTHDGDTLNYRVEQEHNEQTFTYGFAVKELWQAYGMPGVFSPRWAAILLLLFSGMWPHLRLILLQLSWSSQCLSLTPNRRTRTLGWLALSGKWSLADVLTVCVMVGVLNLEWIIDPPTMKEGIANHLAMLIDLAKLVWDDGQICSVMLSFDASDCGSKDLSIKQHLECFSCKQFVWAAFHEPDTVEKQGKAIVEGIEMSGYGAVRLSVVGMKGIYAFCIAVILSILLTVIVDWCNYKYIDMLHERQRGEDTNLTPSVTTNPEEAASLILAGDAASEALEPLLENSSSSSSTTFFSLEIMEDDASVLDLWVQRTTTVYTRLHCHHIIPMVTLVLVGMALYTPSMERKVGGAIPNLLKEVLGLDLNHKYSLASLQDLTGAAGGMDLLLMRTFALFIVLGPLLRAILVVLLAMTANKTASPRMRCVRSLLVHASNLLAAFCAWEVFFAAMFMAESIMPSATNNILNTPACEILSGDGSSCLQVTYERVPTTFAILILGWGLVGGLSILVSMEDSKERMMERHNGQVDSLDAYQPLPDFDGGLRRPEIGDEQHQWRGAHNGRTAGFGGYRRALIR
ncbi:expressed unknown protein [Seminavis robusta]|uniref:Uncharacterized protein n=1 Tax=Seminavis robusta TaxID=568900 RepID=A0A9N8ENJ4_9STRA|nr:expressed unknown protein [Seminavis robusta]|eukprot:Sro1288_g259590.1 n/a (755) ;mRNA; r:17213-19477